MRILYPIFLLFLMSCNAQNTTPQKTIANTAQEVANYNDVLDYKGWPDSVDDRSVFVFTDYGAWHGYGVPSIEKPAYAGSFTGPFLLTQDNGVWLSECLAHLKIQSQKSGKYIDLAKGEWIKNTAKPGALQQEIDVPKEKLTIVANLVFISSRTAFISIDLINKGKERAWDISWEGQPLLEGTTFSKDKNGVRIHFKGNDNIGNIMADYRKKVTYDINENKYKITVKGKPTAKGDTWQVNMTQSFCFTAEEWAAEYIKINGAFSNPPHFKEQPQRMMQTKIDKVVQNLATAYQAPVYQRAAAKCVVTLNNNWRSKAGNFQYSGFFPSYNYEWFNGFWAWDSWKHAVAVAEYQPEVAQQQIQVMYTYQDEDGMIADCVYRDNVIEEDNWRNTKPPLSAWAVWAVYQKNKNRDFLNKILPQVEKYHQWWYSHRDHDQNGLCEYGSTDGTLIAAKWESGMDNAVRFDDAKLLKNSLNAWSMDRESVDLNAYLYAEKVYIGKILKAIRQKEKAQTYFDEAEQLKTKIQDVFYSEEDGWFFDVDITSKKHLKVYGPEGWIPLWANVATTEQAEAVKSTMLDKQKMATFIPLPTLAADHPKFTPTNGYWRGPVWLDQTYFGIKGLRNYGFTVEADLLTKEVIHNLDGFIDSTAPIRENYQPQTGKGLKANHFSWSAAHLLMLMMDDDE